ncbi:MAG: MATE family efflux transporter [Synergistaceae bacterium]|nr:MATE family efflux transporter [Synergistaceae bacterium]
MMLKEKTTTLLLRFALPSMFGMIAGAIYNIVDRIFVGHYVGSTGLAAITTAFPIMVLMTALSSLVGVGGSSRIAILYGAKRKRAAEHVLSQSIVLLFFIGCLVSVIGFYFTNNILHLSGASETLLPMARDYMYMILLAGPLALISFALNPLIRSCGSPRYAMTTQILGAIANIILDAIFIVYFKMGVEGAALGTVLAQAAVTVFGLAFFTFKNTPLRIRFYFMVRPKIEIIKRIMTVGSANFIMQLAFVILVTIMNRKVLFYGGEIGLSAFGVFFSIDTLLFLPAFAIADAVQPIIGYNYGAGLPKRAIETIKKSLVLVTSFYTCSWILAQFFAREIIMLFSDEPELLALGIPGMRIGYSGLVFFGLTVITNAALQGLGKAKESLMLSTMRQGLFMYPLVFILPRFFGFWGIWATFPAGDFLGAFTAFFFMRRTIKWLKSPEALIIK